MNLKVGGVDILYKSSFGGYRIGAELIQPNIILITRGWGGDLYKSFPPK